MTLRAAWCELTERLGLADDWWSDAEARYGVSRREAIRLGTRAPGRRPTLPGSSTCAPISGKTWDELWAARPRRTPIEIASFYQEVGSWCVFRQLVRHRARAFWDVSKRLPLGGTLIEYGCGIAPISWWLSHHRSNFRAVLVDVWSSEQLEFAMHRMAHRILSTPLRSRIYVDRYVVGATLPTLPCADVVAALEVLEHVPNPVQVMRSLLVALKSGGWLFEDFRAHDGDGSPTDLESAAMERPAMYEMLRKECRLLHGEDPEAPGGGGRRWWRKR